MKNKLTILTLSSFVLSIICAKYFPVIISKLDFVGNYYMLTIKYMIVPVVFVSIFSSISNSKVNKVLYKAIFIFILMFLVSFLITAGVSYLIVKPVSLDLQEFNQTTIKFNFIDVLINIIPRDLNKFLQGSNLLFVMIVSFILATFIKNKTIINYVEIIKNFIYKIINYFLYLTPIAVFSLFGKTLLTFSSDAVKDILMYVVYAYLCGVIVVIVVMILPLKLLYKQSIKNYISSISSLLITSISTCSSQCCLPQIISICKNKFNVKSQISETICPLACTIHMCGGAVSFALLTVYNLKLYSIEIDILTFVMMIIFATLINMAAPGIPGGGIIIGASYLTLFNIPLGFIASYIGIYKLLDMAYTSLNVLGDVSANIIISNSNNL